MFPDFALSVYNTCLHSNVQRNVIIEIAKPVDTVIQEMGTCPWLHNLCKIPNLSPKSMQKVEYIRLTYVEISSCSLPLVHNIT